MIGIVMAAEVHRSSGHVSSRAEDVYAPTTLVMVFDNAEQLAEIRRILNLSGNR